jgi:hypothetical protein
VCHAYPEPFLDPRKDTLKLVRRLLKKRSALRNSAHKKLKGCGTAWFDHFLGVPPALRLNNSIKIFPRSRIVVI